MCRYILRCQQEQGRAHGGDGVISPYVIFFRCFNSLRRTKRFVFITDNIFLKLKSPHEKKTEHATE